MLHTAHVLIDSCCSHQLPTDFFSLIILFKYRFFNKFMKNNVLCAISCVDITMSRPRLFYQTAPLQSQSNLDCCRHKVFLNLRISEEAFLEKSHHLCGIRRERDTSVHSVFFFLSRARALRRVIYDRESDFHKDSTEELRWNFLRSQGGASQKKRLREQTKRRLA